MKYSVVVSPQSIRDVRAIFQWLEGRSPQGADRWWDAYILAITELEADPERHALAAENAYYDYPIREKLFRTQHGRRYRVLFTTRADKVHLLRVRGPGQRPITSGDIERPDISS